MFGQNNNQDSEAQEQPINDVVLSPPQQDFNPALPNPGTTFGDRSDPSQPSSVPLPAQDVSAPAPADYNPATADDLLSIKQQALTELSPLISHLEQSPEEKFRTTMMMIQASDNRDLVKDAYAAAQAIPDEKAKAQALLDIVNEINYFTQQPA
ncbi:hypothetical protein H7171_03955 [Candidatus Saccharibacteria bacterium]|nr:hypothetical protein [Candidatus Saccharibacteria bacterium]